ncbi:uncharacterized protein LOC111692721 [Anoplophora glabripennis]|uniref:uncharacterized protein LOC111692721 n=1 Tax=Anoplophora glabripennis TaxID=217634 RepID=UPI000C75B8F5|nr:uncharacterized protein LOC111692721 [Anoplophora glabripennis]
MTELRQLKFKRGQTKGSLTRLQTFFESLNLHSLDEDTIVKLKLRLQRLEPVFDEFSNLQSEIEYKLDIDEASDTEKDKEIVERENFEASYFDLVTKISGIITKFEKSKLNSLTTNVTDSVIANSNNGHSSPFSMSAKLPILKLPSFSGVLDKWLEFRDVFISLVENNASLDEIQKFYYLKSCLEGEAAQLIESISVTAENYSVAWLTLTERYENKRLIVFNYLQTLFDFPVLTKENSVQLRNMFDVFSKNLRVLKNLGQPTEKWDIIIVHLLVSKFDNRTRRDWECFKITGDLPTFDEIKLFLP